MHAVFVTYTLVWMREIVHGEIYSASDTIHDGYDTTLYTMRHAIRGNEEERRKSLGRTRTEKGIAIFRAESSYQEKQQVKRFRPAFFYRQADISRRLRAHVALAPRFRFIGFVIIRTARRARWNERQIGIDRRENERNGISDLIYKTVRCIHICDVSWR